MIGFKIGKVRGSRFRTEKIKFRKKKTQSQSYKTSQDPQKQCLGYEQGKCVNWA